MFSSPFYYLFKKPRLLNPICVRVKNAQKSDKAHFDKCKIIKRVLLTVDQRLKRYENFHYENYPGVVVIKCSSTTPPNVNKHATFVLKRIKNNSVKESLIKA